MDAGGGDRDRFRRHYPSPGGTDRRACSTRPHSMSWPTGRSCPTSATPPTHPRARQRGPLRTRGAPRAAYRGQQPAPRPGLAGLGRRGAHPRRRLDRLMAHRLPARRRLRRGRAPPVLPAVSGVVIDVRIIRGWTPHPVYPRPGPIPGLSRTRAATRPPTPARRSGPPPDRRGSGCGARVSPRTHLRGAGRAAHLTLLSGEASQLECWIRARRPAIGRRAGCWETGVECSPCRPGTWRRAPDA